MKIFDIIDLIQEYAKKSKKFCLYVSFDSTIDYEEIIKAAPYLTQELAIHNNRYILTFDTRKELYDYYDMTIGGDGCTESNSYNGIAKVYAMTINSRGEFETANT